MANDSHERVLAEILQAPSQQRLFVYGTLMQAAASDYGLVARRRLVQEAPRRLPARTRGQLYELGQYPGLVDAATDDATGDEVHGELMLLRDAPATLAWLDEYEAISPAPDADNEYARQLRAVTVVGHSVMAWTYVYVKSAQGLARVPSGRWQRADGEREALMVRG